MIIIIIIIYTFPQPGGPQKIMDGISLASSKVLKRLLFPSTWDWPTYSDKVLGRILSARGVNWLAFDFCAFLLSLLFVSGKYELECRLDTGPLWSVFLFSGDLEVAGVSCVFSFFKGGFEIDFPAKFEELLFKMVKALVVWGLPAKPAFPFDALLLLKVLEDVSGKQASLVGDLFPEPISGFWPPADVARLGWVVFKHLFTCSFTKTAENERPQIGQSTRFVACDIFNQTSEIRLSFWKVFFPP